MSKEVLFWRGHRRAYTRKVDGGSYGPAFRGSPPVSLGVQLEWAFATIDGVQNGVDPLPWRVAFPKRKDEAKIPTVWVATSEDGRRHIEVIAALQGIEVRS